MKVIFRADADKDIGMGHLMRCFALAQAIQSIGEAAFVTNDYNPDIRLKIESENIPVFNIKAVRGSLEDAKETICQAKRFGADWLVLDGYDFGSDYQRYLIDCDAKTLLIDDLGNKRSYWTNLILNQNIYATKNLYTGAQAFTNLLLGCDYALLRKEYMKWRKWIRKIPETARSLMLTVGGSDPNNTLGKLVDSLLELKKNRCEICVVAGQLNPHFADLTEKVNRSDGAVHLTNHVEDMPKQIAWSDLVISAGGSTCYELAFMATPFVTIAIAENQVKIAQCLEDSGISINLGWHQDLSSDQVVTVISDLIENQPLRNKLSESGRKLIDGRGASRVLESMYNYPASECSNGISG